LIDKSGEMKGRIKQFSGASTANIKPQAEYHADQTIAKVKQVAKRSSP
jgi:uncharacterized protein YjbJ (UPF0337 family)